MKKCKTCKKIKPIDEYYTQTHQTKQGQKVYHHGSCKSCSIKKVQENYFANHDRYIEYHRKLNRKERNSARAKATRIWFASLKSKPCMDCGLSFPSVCMDFDHRDPSVKVNSVARMVGNIRSKDVILSEIAKCDLVCSNCHRIRTAKQFEWKTGNE